MRRIATASTVLLLGLGACTDTLTGPTSLQEEIALPGTVRASHIIGSTTEPWSLSLTTLNATLKRGGTVSVEVTVMVPANTPITELTLEVCTASYAGWLHSVTPQAYLNQPGVFFPVPRIFTAVVGPPLDADITTHPFDICVVADDLEAARLYVTITVEEPPPPTTLEVAIDIKPGSDSNPINLGSKGKGNGEVAGPNAKIAVALFSTADFDARLVDVGTVTLGDLTGNDAPVVTKNNGTYQASAEDVDGDNLMDMVFHFSRAELLENGDLTEDSVELFLTGVYADEFGNEQDIIGVDAVRVIY